MKNEKSKKAFTMIELVFVIVIIGILAAVAIPRLAATRDDAEITKARVLVASIRNALAMERQKRILRGDFTPITSVSGSNSVVFGVFSADKNGLQEQVMEYNITSSSDSGHWSINGAGDEYTFNQNSMINPVFVITDGKFVCKTAGTCDVLTD